MSKKTDQEQSAASAVEPALVAAASYTKAQYLASRRFTPAQRDILAAVLVDGRTYTDAEARAALQAYLRKDVK